MQTSAPWETKALFEAQCGRPGDLQAERLQQGFGPVEEEAERIGCKGRGGFRVQEFAVELPAWRQAIEFEDAGAIEMRQQPAGVCVRTGRLSAQTRRSTIIFLISAMALAGFRPFGQVWVQFMMVWQR